MTPKLQQRETSRLEQRAPLRHVDAVQELADVQVPAQVHTAFTSGGGEPVTSLLIQQWRRACACGPTPCNRLLLLRRRRRCQHHCCRRAAAAAGGAGGPAACLAAPPAVAPHISGVPCCSDTCLTQRPRPLHHLRHLPCASCIQATDAAPCSPAATLPRCRSRASRCAAFLPSPWPAPRPPPPAAALQQNLRSQMLTAALVLAAAARRRCVPRTGRRPPALPPAPLCSSCATQLSRASPHGSRALLQLVLT